mmetsp:Transcript_32892/g.28847  ORF Transcript_32892/g.28847 Transcript_32892/m.28847 type:complete len:329 (+) Transcript_32892:71-1057(+)
MAAKAGSEDEVQLIPAQDNPSGDYGQPPSLGRSKSEVADDLREKWIAQSEEFLDWIEHQENLDVYQVAAVLYQTTGMKNPETWKSLFKVFVCGTLQIAGMVYLCCYFMFLQESDEEEAGLTGFDKYCRMTKGSEANDQIELKLLAIFFATWISLVLADQMVDVSQYGLYSFGTAQPPFVNNGIIYLGLIANFFVSIICWLTSVWLMYFSDNVIDLILNGLAIYFMKTIDDEMVFGHDYAMIESWFEDKYSPENDDDGGAGSDSKDKKTHFQTFVDGYIKQLDETDEDERAGCLYADCCNGQCIENPSRCWCILSPLVIIAPVYLAICY